MAELNKKTVETPLPTTTLDKQSVNESLKNGSVSVTAPKDETVYPFFLESQNNQNVLNENMVSALKVLSTKLAVGPREVITGAQRKLYTTLVNGLSVADDTEFRYTLFKLFTYAKNNIRGHLSMDDRVALLSETQLNITQRNEFMHIVNLICDLSDKTHRDTNIHVTRWESIKVACSESIAESIIERIKNLSPGL